MTVYEIRHENLLSLIAQYGSLANLNEALGRKRNDAALSLIKNKSIGFRGKTRNMGTTLARLIEEKLKLEDGWMDKDHSQVKLSKTIEDFALKANKRPVPLLTMKEAGQLTDPFNLKLENFDAFTYIEDPEDEHPQCFAVILTGKSMEPDFLEGDYIHIDPTLIPLPGELVLALCEDFEGNQCTFKKFRPAGFNDKGEEVFELLSLNNDYPPIRSDTKPFSILGVKIGHYRKSTFKNRPRRQP